TIQIRAPNDTDTTLINVTGTLYKSVTRPTDSFRFAVGDGNFENAGSGETGRMRDRVVWSFPKAHTVQLGGPRAQGPTTSWEGNVFAPGATVLVGPSVRVQGTIVAAELQQVDPSGGNSGGDIRSLGLAGVCLPKTCPEPPNGEATPTPT